MVPYPSPYQASYINKISSCWLFPLKVVCYVHHTLLNPSDRLVKADAAESFAFGKRKKKKKKSRKQEAAAHWNFKTLPALDPAH